MADDPNTPTTPNDSATNGAASPPTEERRSLREIAAASWDEVEAASETETPEGTAETPPTGQDGRARDNLGRFAATPVAAKDGQSPPDPALQQKPASPTPPAPVQPQSNEAPQHWGQQDRDMFAKLPKEGQDFLLKRHTEMERDYTAKTQAAATAVQFTQSVAPVFEHPAVAASLVDYQTGGKVHPADAIKQWASFHVRAMSPNQADRVGLLKELMQRMQLDPAAIFGQSQPPSGLSEEDMRDPAIKFFADHVGRTQQEVQALRDQLQNYDRQQQERLSQESMRVTRWGIDQFADEKDAQGQPLHPHFDIVLPQMVELFRANPQRDLKEAYETAVWMNPQLRTTLIANERQSVEQKHDNAKALQAARSNVRGRTTPVSKPDSGDAPKGMRAILAAAADEVGL